MSDYQIAADTLRDDVSGDAELVTVAAADVRAVLARLDQLEAMEQRAQEVDDWASSELSFDQVARYILGEA